MKNPLHWLLATVVALPLMASCAAHQTPPVPRFSGEPKAFEIFKAVPEAETTQRKEQRRDLYVNTASGEPVPFVITTGKVGPIDRQGGRLRLYGDAEGKLGWNVDNFVLIEIALPDGTVLQRVAVGFQQGASLGSEQIDTVGPMQFHFGPGEIDLSRFIPANDPVVITATALDTGSVGSVSDLFLILSEDAQVAGVVDDFRD
ncbi:MAG: hypothetical protein LBM75_02705 [Myxococcales bacterium]|jgi:hypothetical protein|nr:hypothetical protein [Myxococcales bacterium]